MVANVSKVKVVKPSLNLLIKISQQNKVCIPTPYCLESLLTFATLVSNCLCFTT